MRAYFAAIALAADVKHILKEFFELLFPLLATFALHILGIGYLLD